MGACDRRGPLSRTGRAQPDRALAERDPAHFRLDERDTADLILFARRFAAHMRYHGLPGEGTGADADWQAFFDSDISAILASLAKAPVDAFRRALGDVRKFLEDDPDRPEAELRRHFGLLFHLPLALFREVAAREAVLPPDGPLFPVLRSLNEREVGPALAALARYHKGALAAGLVDAGALDQEAFATGAGPRLSHQVARLVFTEEALGAMTLAPRAVGGFAPAGWPDFYDGEDADGAPYADASTVYGRIYDALNYNLLVSAVERVFQAVARTQAEAEARLRDTLETFAGHTPHYGLWLAFLSMFDRAREELNGVTGRHLDFYFEEVLRLARREPVPDHVHLLVDLAKGREAHLLPAGTEVRAGKDALGRAVAYALDESIVANRARVADLRAVRVDAWTAGGQAHAVVRAAPVAASADGLGAELPEEAPHFAPFGPAGAPFARVGFAVSDRQLFMREGTRTIELSLPVSVPGVSSLPGLSARLTAEEGWLELGGALSVSVDDGEMRVEIALDGGHPAIVPADPELHGPGYPPDAPVLELLVDFAAGGNAAARTYARLRDATRGQPELKTEARGLRLISVRTDDGVADPAGEFMPFGAQPGAGAQWIVGSAEAFSRKLQTLTLNLVWAAKHTEDDFFRRRPPEDYQVTFEHLKDGRWVPSTGGGSPLGIGDPTGGFTSVTGGLVSAIEAGPIWTGEFVSKSIWAAGFARFRTVGPAEPAPRPAAITVGGIGEASAAAPLALEEPQFDARARDGFVRMTLGAGFGHGRYVDKKTLRLIEAAKGEEGSDPTDTDTYNYVSGLPLEPYTPTVKEISLDYVSKPAAVARVWRLHPFGLEPADGPGRLLPDIACAGALFVGVEALDPPERLALLVQVADGTGDPLIEPPALEHAYLRDDAWAPFERRKVDDRTLGLAGSGILAYAVPREATPAVRAMPAGLHWVRIAAPANAAAVNRLLSVDAQAVRATFADRGNDPAFLETPLAAGTIAKLEVPDPAVKGLRQPYASFGGRGREDREAFRRRASERLRHKDRAVTMWDYEHLALEAFPAVYRAKALNHTALVRESGRIAGDNELAPGAVTVVAVPWTEDRRHLNPLRPFTERATLTGLAGHLARRVSPFVRLEVENPRFEEVHVEMKVALKPEIADVDFYLAEVEAALVEHLTPWRRRGVRGVEFGGAVYRSTVIDLVEELPFVDFLEDVRLYHNPNPGAPSWTPIDAEVVRATTARSVLVSAASHAIGPL